MRWEFLTHNTFTHTHTHNYHTQGKRRERENHLMILSFLAIAHTLHLFFFFFLVGLRLLLLLVATHNSWPAIAWVGTKERERDRETERGISSPHPPPFAISDVCTSVYSSIELSRCCWFTWWSRLVFELAPNFLIHSCNLAAQYYDSNLINGKCFSLFLLGGMIDACVERRAVSCAWLSFPPSEVVRSMASTSSFLLRMGWVIHSFIHSEGRMFIVDHLMPAYIWLTSCAIAFNS